MSEQTSLNVVCGCNLSFFTGNEIK